MAVKLAVAVRTDLDLGRGKIAAQVAHAAVAAVLGNLGTADFAAWIQDGQPKVVLKVTSAEQRASSFICSSSGRASQPGLLVTTPH